MKKLHGLLADHATPCEAPGKRVVPTLREVGMMVLTLAFMAPVAPFVQMASAADWYVTTNGTGGGTSWADATNSIQGAIDASSAADTVWVSNGVYEAGGTNGYPAGTLLTNRVAIYKAITVQAFSTNPVDTVIKGAWDPITTNGPAAVRCVYMTNGSSLIGFTLTNGATGTAGTDRYGGGLYCQSTNTVVSNCVLTGNSAVFLGGVNSGTLRNCIITRNSASSSTAGAGSSTLYDCTISHNSSLLHVGGVNSVRAYNCIIISNTAPSGYAGGAYYAFLMTNCTISYNSAATGGGARDSILYNCTIASNSATTGGGTYYSTNTNCILTRNSAQNGGGACYGTLYNCTLTYNTASDGGGGTYGSTLYNCKLTGNSAVTGGGTRNGASYNSSIVGNSSVGVGGGIYVGTTFNCISWDNNKDDTVGTYNYSCGAGYTNGGSISGNITNNPLFIANGSGFGTNHVAGNYRLRGNSPCINAGTNFSWMTDLNDVRSKDLDGRPRIRGEQVDMGCYEYLSSGTMFAIQ